MAMAAQLSALLGPMLARLGLPPASAVTRLTGGATMESWCISSGGADYVLRRAPSPAFMAGRPFGHAEEAAIIRAARAGGVRAPEIIGVLEDSDALGSGFLMRALPGTADPGTILGTADGPALLAECAGQLARVHALSPAALSEAVPTLDYRAGVAELVRQFEATGGDRPIIALGLRWLRDNCPPPAEPVLNHGDFRLGNLLVDDGRLTGVLDWELAHLGDWHEDLAFGCMAVWRFARYDRPALGLGSLDDYFAAYETAGGRTVDLARFRFWSVYRTVWWALGCLRQAQVWRDGQDRMLERVVISRRTSENELDLLMLLDGELAPGIAPSPAKAAAAETGEASAAELAEAVGEWLASLKDKVSGHDRFQLAVARNALGMAAREHRIAPNVRDRALADALLAGRSDDAAGAAIAQLRRDALDKLAADVPKYPALAAARALWEGED